MQPLASSWFCISCSTSSSLSFSPEIQRKEIQRHIRSVHVLIMTDSKIQQAVRPFNSPSVARTCLSSAPMTVPFPSLSNTLRPSTKSSNVPRSLALQICWCMGRNCSKSSILVCMSVEKSWKCWFYYRKIQNGTVMTDTTVHTAHLQPWASQGHAWSPSGLDSGPKP